MSVKQIIHSSLLSLLIFFISSNVLNGQEIADSLRNKSKLELQLIYNSTKNATPKKAKVYAHALFVLAQKKNDKKDLAEALYNKAYIENKLGNRSTALQLVEDSKDINAIIKSDSLELKNANLKGIIYSLKNEYLKSIDAYLEAKAIAEKMNNTKDALIISHNIAIIKQEINDLQGALEIFLSNLKRIEASKTPFLRQKLLTYFTITDTYLRLENLEKASHYNALGLNNSSDAIHSDLHTFFKSNKAIIRYKQKKYEEAIKIYNDIKNDIDELSNTKLQIIAYLHLGKSHFELENYDETISNFENIRNVSDDYKNVSPYNLRDIYYYLAKSYIKTDKPDLANKSFDLLIDLDKENDILTKNAERKIYQNFDLANLKEELNVLNDKLSKQRKTAYYMYGLAFLSIIVVVLFYKRKQKLNKQRFEKLVLEIESLEKKKNDTTIKSSDPIVTDENVIEILENLEEFEKNKSFLNSDCTLGHVAKKINTNTTYLSNVINKHKGKPFKTYLAELRINEALIQIKNNKKLRAYTIKAIASEFGFKRQETFSRAFKLRTGIYPSTYIKNLDNKNIT